MKTDPNHQTDLQRVSQRLVSDYMRYLVDQEALVERIVEQKLAECLPQMEENIQENIQNHIINHLKTKLL